MRKIFTMLLSLIIIGSIYAQKVPETVTIGIDTAGFVGGSAAGYTLTKKSGYQATFEDVVINNGKDSVLKVTITTSKHDNVAGISLLGKEHIIPNKYVTPQSSPGVYEKLAGKIIADIYNEKLTDSIRYGYKMPELSSATMAIGYLAETPADTWSYDVPKSGSKNFIRNTKIQAAIQLGCVTEGIYYFDNIRFQFTNAIDATPKLTLNSATSIDIGTDINITSDTTATLYLVPEGTASDSVSIKGAAEMTKSATPNAQTIISTTTLNTGNYVVYAIAPYLVSEPTAVITITASSDTDAPNKPTLVSNSVDAGNNIAATTNEDCNLYLVLNGGDYSTIDKITNASEVTVAATANNAANLNTTGIDPGQYIVYAIDAAGNISTPSDVVTINQIDFTAPDLSNVSAGIFTISDTLVATSSENGWIYLVPDGTPKNLETIKSKSVITESVLQGIEDTLFTDDIYENDYIVYAVDLAKNISNPSAKITINRPTPKDYAHVFTKDTIGTSWVSKSIILDGIDINLSNVKWYSSTNPVNEYLKLNKSSENPIASIEWITKFGVGSVRNTCLKGMELYVNGVLIDTVGVDETINLNMDVQNNNPDTIKLVNYQNVIANYKSNTLYWSEYGAQITDVFPPTLSSLNLSPSQGGKWGVKSSEDAWVYIVDFPTAKDAGTIKANFIDSLYVTKDIKATKNTGATTPGKYSMYAIDLAGNLSDSSATITIVEDSTTVTLMDVSTPVTIGDSISVKTDWASTVFLVPEGTAKVLADIKAAKIDSVVVIDSVYGKIATAGLAAANYLVYAVEASENISNSWAVTLEAPADQTAPQLSNVTAGPINIGDTIYATSNEDGVLYLVPEGISKGLIEVKDAAVAEKSVVANQTDTLFTSGINTGSYIVYAADAVGNLSDASTAIVINIPPDKTAPVLSLVTEGSITVGDDILVTSNEEGMFYLVPDTVGKVVADILSTKVAEAIASGNSEDTINTINVPAGKYIVYAVDTADNVSNASATIIINNPPDLVAPVLSNVTSEDIYQGTPIVATSNEEGIIYLVPDGTAKVLATIKLEKAAEVAVQAGIEASLATSFIDTGLYIVFAVDTAENISNASTTIRVLYLADTEAPKITSVATDTITVGETIAVTVNENSVVYLVADSTANTATEIVAAKASDATATANTEVLVSTAGVTTGSYVIYAIDPAGNVSLSSDTIIINPSLDVTAPELSVLTTSPVKEEEAIYAKSNEDGMLYLVPAGEYVSVTNLKDTAVYSTVVTATITDTLFAATAGNYQIYAVDVVGNISAASDTIIVVALDKTAPVLSNVTSGDVIVGDTIYATSNKNGILYLVADSINVTFNDIVEFAQVTTTATADVEAIFNTENLNEGNYVVFAMDEVNNISDASAVINLIASVVEPVDTVAPILSNVTSGNVTIGDVISATSNEDGMLYLVADSTSKVLTDITTNNVANASVDAEKAAELSTEGLLAGTYVVYAVDTAENISDASAVITLVEPVIVDTVAPVLSNVTEGTIASGTNITATSNEDAALYLVPEGTAKEVAAITTAQVATTEATAETAATLSTADLSDGNYVVYAIDAAENISDASAVISILAVSISESMFNELRIYPNPASNYIILSNTELKEAAILNISGKKVKQINLAYNKVEISELESGIYIIKAVSNNGLHYLGRFIKN